MFALKLLYRLVFFFTSGEGYFSSSAIHTLKIGVSVMHFNITGFSEGNWQKANANKKTPLWNFI
jgi:hypothetical protein